MFQFQELKAACTIHDQRSDNLVLYSHDDEKYPFTVFVAHERQKEMESVHFRGINRALAGNLAWWSSLILMFNDPVMMTALKREFCYRVQHDVENGDYGEFSATFEPFDTFDVEVYDSNSTYVGWKQTVSAEILRNGVLLEKYSPDPDTVARRLALEPVLAPKTKKITIIGETSRINGAPCRVTLLDIYPGKEIPIGEEDKQMELASIIFLHPDNKGVGHR